MKPIDETIVINGINVLDVTEDQMCRTAKLGKRKHQTIFQFWGFQPTKAKIRVIFFNPKDLMI